MLRVAGVAGELWAQSGASPAPAETAQATGFPVSGRVVCADTQRAARFAQVTLIPATSEDEGGGFGGGRGGRGSARTDLDGNFSVPSVAPGEYYVTAQLTGYVNEAPSVQAALSQAGGVSTGAAGLANVPKIRVGAGGASALLSLQRGGVIAGSVQWDDGTPAAGVQVSAVSAPPTAQGAAGTQAGFQTGNGFGGGGFGGPGGFGGGQTDDRGHFRLSGLAPGAYLVRANVQAPAPAAAAARDGGRGIPRTLNLSVYAPDKLRHTEAATVTLAPGEERGDLLITMKLGALHSVEGSIGSSSAPVRSGSVSLTDQTDSSLTRTGNLNADGTFLVPYVPAGNYTLRANASSQALSFGRGGQTQTGGSPAVRFQPLEESITVTDSDLTGLSLNVTAATATTPAGSP